MDEATFQVSSIRNDLDAYKQLSELEHQKSQTFVERTRTDLEFEIKNLISTIDLEKQEIFKMKHQMKLTLHNEIEALKGQEKDTIYELQRLNLLTNKLADGI